ncbi:MAG: hypothetical protein Q8761_03210, partial [Sweet potato little leaf phytoplasma]|nr:hypothetical protein [Sweet potato little leaf phytoplasma]
TNEEFFDYFDKLILSTGSWPVIPKLEGIDSKNLFLCKNFCPNFTPFKFLRARNPKFVPMRVFHLVLT